jgi:hypothetical protein
MAAETDATAMIVAGLGAGFASLASLLSAIALAKFSSLTKTAADLGRDIQALALKVEGLVGKADTAKSEIESLKKNNLTRELFEHETDAQNEKLDRLDRKVEKIDRGLGARPTRSEMSMQAVRPPPRRTDGPGDDESPSDPPPVPRPRKPSSPGRYGAE